MYRRRGREEAQICKNILKKKKKRQNAKILCKNMLKQIGSFYSELSDLKRMLELLSRLQPGKKFKNESRIQSHTDSRALKGAM